ncbi:MAG: hypothetical protein HUJ22_13665 [Gracilimonas sp.]|uniref:hypothetical protein n=1 Tax=Gracilimonas sp. TaxID=1974203 RepID=UPI0019B118A5|nr:hypothetical protein [Gracilimonas sp.]MBD3617608.1 hypothetical protein [Gracilimonas sp.]
MKKLFITSFIFALLLSTQLSAQLRENLPASYTFSGPIINTQAPSIQSWLNDFFQNKVTMSHSYSMSFGAVGGTYQNVNAYTNTLNFMITPDLTGRVDVSFLHSPFGGSDFVNSDNNLNGEILIRNAELNYKISDNAHIRFQYQQLPSGYGIFNRGGYGMYGYDRFNPWY